jgi:hypothetical protein
MTVESQLNRGTIVRVWLPALFDIEEKAAKKSEIEPNRAAGTIPMVENEAYGTKMIRRNVRSARNSWAP